MKITVNEGGRYITLTTETRDDEFRLGKICGLLNKGSATSGEARYLEMSFNELIKALARCD